MALPLNGDAVLNDKAVLIIEDNVFLALDLSSAVEDLDGRVVGPAATAAEALRLLGSEEIAAAVFGCEIADDDVTQVVMLLADKGIPVVIHAATEPPTAVVEILSDAPILRAPIQSKVVLARLIEEVAKRADSAPDAPPL